MGGCLRKIGDGILSVLVMLIILVWLAGSFLGDDTQDYSDEMPDAPFESVEQDPNAMPGSAPDGSFGPEDDGDQILPGPSPFDEASRVRAEDAPDFATGTGFAIGKGLWLTARHVVRGCEGIGVINETGQTAVKARPVYISEDADVAILATEGGPEPLALDLDESDLKIGARGFHVGYPQGRPGEVSSRLIGRELMYTEGAWRGKENTLAWAEAWRSDNLKGTLGGLSGGPAFDSQGRVIGITIAENPRRGRVITTSAQSVLDALQQANLQPRGTPFGQIASAQFPTSARALRKSLKVMQVVCLPTA
jgi:serine protease Do